MTYDISIAYEIGGKGKEENYTDVDYKISKDAIIIYNDTFKVVYMLTSVVRYVISTSKDE